MVERFQYQAKTQPVLVPVATVPTFGWFQELSRPPVLKAVLSTALLAGAVAPVFTPPASSLAMAWHEPLSLPVWAKPGLLSGAQQAYAAPTFVPPAASITVPWFAALSEPTRKPPPQPASGLTEPATTPRADSLQIAWYRPLELPVWQKPGLAAGGQQFLAEPLSEAPEITSVDRWYQAFSLPVWQKPGLAAAGQVAFWWSGFTPAAAVTVTIGWFEPLSTPTLRTAFQPTSGDVQPISESPETTTVDRWYQNLSLYPGRTPSLAHQPQAYVAPLSEQPETTSVDRWYQNLALPVWQRAALLAAQQQAYAAPVTTPAASSLNIAWFEPLSEPVRLPLALGAASQQAFWWSDFTPSPVVVPSMAGWYIALSEPYPASRAVAWQQAYSSYISMEPGTIIPPASGTVPGPSDGVNDEDGGRRRWLEWRDRRMRQKAVRQPPALPVVAKRVAEPIVEAEKAVIAPLRVDVGPAIALLSANLRAMRDQKDALARKEAEHKAALDDDDDAITWLLS